MTVKHCEIGPRRQRDGRPAVAWVRVQAPGYGDRVAYVVLAACADHARAYERVAEIPHGA